MRLSWNEVRARAAAFAKDWQDATYEKGETQSFYNAFFRVFGVQRRTVARYEAHVTKLDNRSGFIDLFWPGVLLVEQKSAGRDLDKAYQQAGEYFDALRERERPRYILVSDYINGNLFKGRLQTVSFNATMRSALLDACRFDWSKVSPGIFGALFQSVMDPSQRHAQGAHYTTEKNILKVIEPLFMEDLRAEFARIKTTKTVAVSWELRQFHAKLGKLTFFDPACGCGNFLIITYRELRLLETEALKALYPKDQDGHRQMGKRVADLSQVNVDRFYGIEPGEFPARIAETALWMMDHIMNNRLSLESAHAAIHLMASLRSLARSFL